MMNEHAVNVAEQAEQRLDLLDALRSIMEQCGPIGVAVVALFALEFDRREIAAILGLEPVAVSTIAKQARKISRCRE